MSGMIGNSRESGIRQSKSFGKVNYTSVRYFKCGILGHKSIFTNCPDKQNKDKQQKSHKFKKDETP